MKDKELYEYDLLGHWMSEWIWFEWGQTLFASYMVWKTKRKLRRYRKFKSLIKK